MTDEAVSERFNPITGVGVPLPQARSNTSAIFGGSPGAIEYMFIPPSASTRPTRPTPSSGKRRSLSRESLRRSYIAPGDDQPKINESSSSISDISEGGKPRRNSGAFSSKPLSRSTSSRLASSAPRPCVMKRAHSFTRGAINSPAREATSNPDVTHSETDLNNQPKKTGSSPASKIPRAGAQSSRIPQKRSEGSPNSSSTAGAAAKRSTSETHTSGIPVKTSTPKQGSLDAREARTDASPAVKPSIISGIPVKSPGSKQLQNPGNSKIPQKSSAKQKSNMIEKEKHESKIPVHTGTEVGISREGTWDELRSRKHDATTKSKLPRRSSIPRTENSKIAQYKTHKNEEVELGNAKSKQDNKKHESPYSDIAGPYHVEPHGSKIPLGHRTELKTSPRCTATSPNMFNRSDSGYGDTDSASSREDSVMEPGNEFTFSRENSKSKIPIMRPAKSRATAKHSEGVPDGPEAAKDNDDDKTRSPRQNESLIPTVSNVEKQHGRNILSVSKVEEKGDTSSNIKREKNNVSSTAQLSETVQFIDSVSDTTNKQHKNNNKNISNDNVGITSNDLGVRNQSVLARKGLPSREDQVTAELRVKSSSNSLIVDTTKDCGRLVAGKSGNNDTTAKYHGVGCVSNNEHVVTPEKDFDISSKTVEELPNLEYTNKARYNREVVSTSDLERKTAAVVNGRVEKVEEVKNEYKNGVINDNKKRKEIFTDSRKENIDMTEITNSDNTKPKTGATKTPPMTSDHHVVPKKLENPVTAHSSVKEDLNYVKPLEKSHKNGAKKTTHKTKRSEQSSLNGENDKLTDQSYVTQAKTDTNYDDAKIEDAMLAEMLEQPENIDSDLPRQSLNCFECRLEQSDTNDEEVSEENDADVTGQSDVRRYPTFISPRKSLVLCKRHEKLKGGTEHDDEEKPLTGDAEETLVGGESESIYPNKGLGTDNNNRADEATASNELNGGCSNIGNDKVTLPKQNDIISQNNKSTVLSKEPAPETSQRTSNKTKNRDDDKPAASNKTRNRDDDKPAASNKTRNRDDDKPAASNKTRNRDDEKPAASNKTRNRDDDKPAASNKTRNRDDDKPAASNKTRNRDDDKPAASNGNHSPLLALSRDKKFVSGENIAQGKNTEEIKAAFSLEWDDTGTELTPPDFSDEDGVVETGSGNKDNEDSRRPSVKLMDTNEALDKLKMIQSLIMKEAENRSRKESVEERGEKNTGSLKGTRGEPKIARVGPGHETTGEPNRKPKVYEIQTSSSLERKRMNDFGTKRNNVNNLSREISPSSDKKTTSPTIWDKISDTTISQDQTTELLNETLAKLKASPQLGNSSLSRRTRSSRSLPGSRQASEERLLSDTERPVYVYTSSWMNASGKNSRGSSLSLCSANRSLPSSRQNLAKEPFGALKRSESASERMDTDKRADTKYRLSNFDELISDDGSQEVKNQRQIHDIISPVSEQPVIYHNIELRKPKKRAKAQKKSRNTSATLNTTPPYGVSLEDLADGKTKCQCGGKNCVIS